MHSTTVQRTRPLDPAKASGRQDARTTSSKKPASPLIAIELHRAMAPVEALWRKLETDHSCSIHQTYDWCAAWAETHRADVLIFVGRLDGEPGFILPLEIVRRGPFRLARYIASPHSNINNGIFSDAFREACAARPVARECLREIRRLRAGVDCIALDKVPLAWAGQRHPFGVLPSIENQNRSFQVTLHRDFNAVLAQVNAKRRRKKFRTSERRLDEIGGYEHVIARTPDEAHALLDVFFGQKAARFEAHGIPDVFAEPSTKAFFHALAAAGSDGERTPLQLHGIRLKGEHAGSYCAVAGLSLKGSHVICQFGSIDDSLCPDASPGELLFHLMIEKCCHDGAAIFDFGIGDQAYKRSWCNVETVHHDFVLPLTLRGRMLAGAIKAKVSGKRFVKRNPQAYAAAQKLRTIRMRTFGRQR